MNFTFETIEIDPAALKNEAAAILEKHTELVSRQKYPELWQVTDKVNEKTGGKKAVQKVSKGRLVRYRVFGIILLFLGLFLFIPGLTDPKELMIPLVTGSLAAVLGGFYIFLGFFGKPSSFDKSADILISMHKKGYTAVFDDSGMSLAESNPVSYSDIERMIESENLFAFIWQGQIVLLQKSELKEQSPEDFSSFMREKLDEQKIFTV